MLKITEWTLFGILVCLCGLLLLSNYTTHLPLKVYTVLTGSMEPAIPTGSLVLGFPVDSAQLTPGDIITFASPDEPGKQIIHRIHSTKTTDGQTYFLTKGDNNNSLDDWQIYPPQIFSRAYIFIPQLGYLAAQSKTPLGFAATVGLPALFVLAMYIRQIVQGVREYADHKAKKAVGEYIKSQRKAQTLHQMLSAYLLLACIPVATAYAAFSTQLTADNIVFATAEQFATPEPSSTPEPSPSATPPPTATPTPSITPTPTPSASAKPCTTNCSTILLNQPSSTQNIQINANTQGGSQTIIVENSQTQTQSQAVTTQTTSSTNSQQ